ncbi:MAG: hypothetical protein KDH16_18925 [Rhodocyclaceae bacterium]|nr:hypothetical protein [Rhodocyclaceae bacterium]
MSGYTAEQLEALRSAVARGVRSVSFDGETVTYHSLAEMQSLIRAMETDLGMRAPRTRVYPGYSRDT